MNKQDNKKNKERDNSNKYEVNQQHLNAAVQNLRQHSEEYDFAGMFHVRQLLS